MLKEKESEIIEMVRHILRAYECFYGEPNAPTPDIIKKIIKTILEVSPEGMRLQIKYSEVSDKVINRVVEKIYYIAVKELKGKGDIKYIC